MAPTPKSNEARQKKFKDSGARPRPREKLRDKPLLHNAFTSTVVGRWLPLFAFILAIAGHNNRASLASQA